MTAHQESVPIRAHSIRVTLDLNYVLDAAQTGAAVPED
jgi:hypothetical protein